MLKVTVNNKPAYSVEKKDNEWLINENVVDFDVLPLPNGLISILYNGKSYTAIVNKVDRKAKELTININGQNLTIKVKEPIDQLLASMGLDMAAMKKAEPVKAPMPGMILKVLVEQGQQIEKGDGLLILEAMKMENVIKATGTATVKSIKAIEQTAVEKGAVLIELE